MAGDIEENVNIHVNSEGLKGAAAEAEEVKSRIDAVRDAWAEEGAAAEAAGAEGAAAAAEQAAALEAVKAQLDGVRDKTAEVGLAQDASAAQAAGMADAIKAAADAGSKLKASQDTLGRGTVRDPFAQAIRDRYAGADQEIQQGKRDTEEMSRAMQDMERSIPREGLLGTQGGLKAASEMDRYAESIEKLKADLAEADPLISDSGRAIDDVSRKAGIAATSMGNWHAAMSDIDHGGLPSIAGMASREMDSALGDFGRSGDDAVRTLEDLGRAGEDTGRDLEDLAGGGGRGGIIGGLSSAFSGASKNISSAGSALGGVGSKLQGALMPAAWTALAAGISTIGPVVLSAGAGFASFGAMALPALRGVEQGVTNVNAAQKAYSQAKAVYAADPTKTNLTAEQTALAQLKATWATMPGGIRKSVSAIDDLGHAWSEAGKKSGIQKDALKDIPKAIGDIKGLIPTVTSLGKATAPVISGMLKDFGKFEKSSGFQHFISNIKNQIPQAMPALHSLGNALSTLTASLFSSKNMKIGDSLLTNVSGMLKNLSPGAVDELGQVAKDMSGMAKWTSTQSKPGGVLQETGRAWDDFWHGASNVWKMQTRIGSDLNKPLSGLFHIGDSQSTGTPTSRSELEALQRQKGGDVKVRVDESGIGKAKSQVDSLRKDAGKTTTAHVKAKVEGGDQAKSTLKGINSDARKVSDTKADLKVRVTGADSAKSSLHGIQTAAQQAGNTKADVKVTVTGAPAAVSSLNSVGTAGSQMASGVQSGSSRATGAVTSMAASMRGAIAGLPAAFRAAGQSAGAGMASGIEASTGEAVAAARSMASQVEAAAKTELQSHSPSKKFQKIGADTILGYILGLEGGKGRVQAAMNAVLGAQPFKDTVITKTISELRKKLQAMAGGPGWDNPVKGIQATGLTKLLDADNKKLMGLAKQRMDLLNQIKAADALAKSVETAAASLGDVTTIAPNTQQGLIQSDMAQGAPGTSQQPFQNIQSGMKYQLSQIKQFRADIVKLKKEGLDKTSIKQLLNAGISGGGLSTAQQILGEGPGAAKQIANLQKQIEQASKQLGITGGNAAYEGASQIGGQLAAGLKDSLKAVNQEMASIAKTLVTSLMTALGASGKDIREAIKKLDKELGIGGGSGSGGGGGKPGPIVEHHKGARPGPVIHHPARHIPLMPLPPGQMMPGGARPGPVVAGGSDTETINNVITVLLDGKVVSRSNQTHTLRRARRNTRSGMTLPLRGT